MYDLSYFNLGFRSDNVSNYLEELLSNGHQNEYLLEDAMLIIEDCLKVKEESSIFLNFNGSSGRKGYENHTLLPLLSELYVNESVKNIVTTLKKVCEAIKKIGANKDSATKDEYKLTIKFFSDLSKLCLSNSTQISNSEKLAFA